MPRVLRIINRLNLGGPTYNVAYLSKFLEPEFETLLVSGMKEDSEESSEFIVQKLGLQVTYIPEMHRNINLNRDLSTYRKLREIILDFKPDIVHTHAAKAGTIGRLAAKSAGVPVIVHTFHGHVFHSYFSPLKTRIFLGIERYLARKTTRIIAISDKQKNELAGQFRLCAPEKIDVIPLGFDLARFTDRQDQKRKDFRDAYQLQDDEIAIGIVGRLVPIKNHGLFLEALKLILPRTPAKIRAFIIGDGELRARIEAQCSSLGISYCTEAGNSSSATVTFTSWIKDIDVAYAGLDMVALSSLNEGTPVSLIEAQAAGKPIVSTNVGGIEDIVIPGVTAMLSETNAEAFAENLLRVVSNIEQMKKMSEDKKNDIISRFGYQRLVQDTSDLYNRLLKLTY